MLKIYRAHIYVSIDGADWRELDFYGYRATEEEPQNTVVLDNASFIDVCEALSEDDLRGVHKSYTFFKHRPIVCISYIDALDNVEYRHFKTMSYKIEFEEWSNVTLKWMVDNMSADKCIQYLKERGITTCPMNF